MHFYFVLMVSGCLPYVDLALNKQGEALSFDSYTQAEKWAKKNCAWQYQVVQF